MTLTPTGMISINVDSDVTCYAELKKYSSKSLMFCNNKAAKQVKICKFSGEKFQGPVVQSIVSLTTSLSKCFMKYYSNIPICFMQNVKFFLCFSCCIHYFNKISRL